MRLLLVNTFVVVGFMFSGCASTSTKTCDDSCKIKKEAQKSCCKTKKKCGDSCAVQEES